MDHLVVLVVFGKFFLASNKSWSVIPLVPAAFVAHIVLLQRADEMLAVLMQLEEELTDEEARKWLEENLV